VLAKLIIFAVIAIGLVISDAIPGLYLQPMYHVSAPFQFIPADKSTICTPYEGYIKKDLRSGRQRL